MEKHKKVQEKKELFLQFSEEEIQEMGWEEGQKLSLDLDKDTGVITLKPFVKMDIDIGEWPRETLEFLVGESCDRDVSVNEIINEVLLNSIRSIDRSEQLY